MCSLFYVIRWFLNVNSSKSLEILNFATFSEILIRLILFFMKCDDIIGSTGSAVTFRQQHRMYCQPHSKIESTNFELFGPKWWSLTTILVKSSYLDSISHILFHRKQSKPFENSVTIYLLCLKSWIKICFQPGVRFLF